MTRSSGRNSPASPSRPYGASARCRCGSSLSTHADPAERLHEETGLALADRIPWQDLTINVLEELFPWIPGQSLPAVETLMADYRTVLRRMLGSIACPTPSARPRPRSTPTAPEHPARRHAAPAPPGWEVTWADSDPPPTARPFTRLRDDYQLRLGESALRIWAIGINANMRSLLPGYETPGCDRIPHT